MTRLTRLPRTNVGEALVLTGLKIGTEKWNLTIDSDFETSNSIALDINGSAITATPFNTDHATTLSDLATNIAGSSVVASATVVADGSGSVKNSRIEIVAIDDTELSFGNLYVTGGSNQPDGEFDIVKTLNDVLAMPTVNVSGGSEQIADGVSGGSNGDYDYTGDASAAKMITVQAIGASLDAVDATVQIWGSNDNTNWDSYGSTKIVPQNDSVSIVEPNFGHLYARVVYTANSVTAGTVSIYIQAK